MLTPKIKFRYSLIYDRNCLQWSKLSGFEGESLTKEQIRSYISAVEPKWRTIEKSILKELSRISCLPWKTKEISCYVVSCIIPFSDPLTLPVYLDHPDYFIDVLIHELIHCLFTEDGNLEKARNAWEYIHKRYAKESQTTRIHIPLYAIHSYIYYKFFDENRLKRDYNLIKKVPDYKKAWEVVFKEGYLNIIDKFTKRIS